MTTHAWAHHLFICFSNRLVFLVFENAWISGVVISPYIDYLVKISMGQQPLWEGLIDGLKSKKKLGKSYYKPKINDMWYQE